MCTYKHQHEAFHLKTAEVPLFILQSEETEISFPTYDLNQYSEVDRYKQNQDDGTVHPQYAIFSQQSYRATAQ